MGYKSMSLVNRFKKYIYPMDISDIIVVAIATTILYILILSL